MTTQKAEPGYPSGFTVGIYLPAQAPKEYVDRVADRVAELVYGEMLDDRGDWDPAVVGHPGDVFLVDSESGLHPHIYLSTSCLHEDHSYCASGTGVLGNKKPSACKFCEAPCVCKCHGKKNLLTDS